MSDLNNHGASNSTEEIQHKAVRFLNDVVTAPREEINGSVILASDSFKFELKFNLKLFEAADRSWTVLAASLDATFRSPFLPLGDQDFQMPGKRRR